MNDPKMAFQRNLKILSPDDDAVQWNLNDGLLDLCQQVEQMASQLQEMKQMMADLRKQVRNR